jgi:large subunit ribosomal protein L22
MKAFLKNYRQAPRKVRLIANHVRGKNAAEALAVLEFMPNKGAKMMHKLVSSAIANAKQQDASLTADTLVIKTVTANKGITFVRYMPRAFGRAYPINRECSHVYVELAPKTGKGGKAAAKAEPVAEPVKEDKPKAKKAPAKKRAAAKKTK